MVLQSFLFQLKVEYRLVWANTTQNIGKEECTWEPTENLTGCAELLNKFICSKAHQIIAAKQFDDGSIEYLMTWNDGWSPSSIPSNEVKSKW